MNPLSHERLEELLSKVLDSDLSPAERTELNALLRDDSNARRHFHRYMNLHTDLEWMLNPEVLESALNTETLKPAMTPMARPRHGDKIMAWSGWLALAASVALFFAIRFSQQTPPTERAALRPPSKTIFVARANYSGDARIGPASTVHQQGDWLSQGRIILESGTLGLTFDSGARVVLNAPSEFELESSNRGFLHSGQAIAQVPHPASGFIINTPNSTLVDLGTEFTVQVDPHQSSVKVLDGEVKAYTETKEGHTKELLLQRNQAVQIDSSTADAFTPAQHFSPETFHDWSRFYEPHADYIHFSFNQTNEAITSSAWGAGGKIIGENAQKGDPAMPRPRMGVFGQAMRFDGQGAFLTTNLEGISGSAPRTVACWIQLPPEQYDTAISIISWGKPTRGGRWQVGINHSSEFGTLGALRTDFSQGYVTGTTDLRDGRWHHIASVYIGGNSADIASRIRHYVDGKLESVSQVYQASTVNTQINPEKRSDNLTIGYRNMGGHKERIHTFKGSIDEFYLFNAAILPSQIEHLKNHNSPNTTTAL